ncbi:MAG: sugar phosphate isomerase/epimerase [Planctomycetota bacterium]|nr:MAG: sugar phosphate isomerase/epimerase [Planctomycetota bacterium]
MVPLSINELTTLRWSFEEDVLNYRAAGIAAMGVWRGKLADYGEERGAELLAEHDMAVSNLLWAGGFTGSEGPSYCEAIADAEAALELAATLDAGCLVLYSGGRVGHTARHARRVLKDALKHLDPIAAGLGVTLALEPMHPAVAEPCTLLTSIDETLDAIAAAGCRATKVAFDTYHLGHALCRGAANERGRSAAIAQLAEIAPLLAVVHLADSRGAPRTEQNRCRLGSGTLPLVDIVAALVAGGYRGYYDVELFGEDVEWFDYAELIAHSQRMFRRLGAAVEAPSASEAAANDDRVLADRCDFERSAAARERPRRAVG